MIPQKIKDQYDPDNDLHKVTWVDITLFEELEKCIKQGDPLLQYLFNTIAQLNTRVARLENPEEFDFIGESEDEI